MANEASPCPCDIGHRLEYGGMGREVQVEHIRAYVTGPPADTGKAVIVVQDIFGWELPNTRYMADLIAGNGYTTIVPDFFVGKEPWSPSADMKTFPEWFKSRDARKVDKYAVATGGVGLPAGTLALRHLSIHESVFAWSRWGSCSKAE